MTKYTATWAGLSIEIIGIPDKVSPRTEIKTTGSGKTVRTTLPGPKLVACLVDWTLPVNEQLLFHLEAGTTAAFTLYADERPVVVFENAALVRAQPYGLAWTWAFDRTCEVSP